MASITSWDSSSISTLFSSVNTQNKAGNKGMQQSFNFGIDLSEYASIKGGSYFKLLKTYYSDVEAETPKSSISTSKDSTKLLAGIQEEAQDLTKTATDLYKNTSLFDKKDGKYDTEKIYEAVKGFVDDYNSVVEKTSKSNVGQIANTTAAMVNFSSVNKGILGSLGITMNSKDYTLEIDEDTFKNADMAVAKSMFQGTGSFAYSVGCKASMIKVYAQNEAAKSNTYTSSGGYTYNYSTGELYSSIT